MTRPTKERLEQIRSEMTGGPCRMREVFEEIDGLTRERDEIRSELETIYAMEGITPLVTAHIKRHAHAIDCPAREGAPVCTCPPGRFG